MNQFLTRVELHGVYFADYTKLHAEMERLNFSRTIQSNIGLEYQLPTAEYFSYGNITVQEVAELAKSAANTTGKGSNVITVEYTKAYFYLNYAPSPFASLLQG